ncbi:MAG: hypothetical protein KIT25_21390 [Enhydrobacter sp.]|nr:MAG: hypothetical protein KIT25_21390 [Enhydrobacter sp.]
MNTEKLVTEIVTLNADKKLVGKTRLQKTFYLLDQLGMNSDAEFDYHHYGPYSEDVASAAEMATLLYDFEADERRSGARDVTYVVYSSKEKQPKALGNLSQDRAKAALTSMASVSDVVLELAATMVFLRNNGYEKDFVDEVRERKPLKATEDRLRRAQDLIKELGLDRN